MNSSLESSKPPAVPVATLPDAAARASSAERAPRKSLRPVVLAILGLGMAGWVAHFILVAYRYEKTDNAYIVGHLHQVGAQIDGPVKEVLVRDNQTVKAGDPLVRLDPLQYDIAAQKARAALAQAQAGLAQATAAISQTEAQAAEAQARVVQADAQTSQSTAQLELARLTLARTEKLFADNGAVTPADVDNARSAFNVATATLAAAHANAVAAEAGVRSAQAAQKASLAQVSAAEANVAAAEAAVHDAEREVAYATISAPSDGRVGNRAVEVGNRVQAGQALLALVEPDVWVVANFKETQLARMAPGMPVEMTIDALPGETIHGQIDSLAPASGAQFALLPPDNATGNFNKVVQRVPVKITLDPATLQRLGERLRAGFSVIVSIRVR